MNDTHDTYIDTLATGIRSHVMENINGLSMHVLEAGEAGHPRVLLLHGFPELAYSWRKIMLPLADAGYHVVAPDQRGYGRTTGWDAGYDGDRCAQLFAILENETLDLGDYDGVFGPEHLLDPTEPGYGDARHQFQRWLWTRTRGYLPLRERRERVIAYLREKQAEKAR